MKVAWIVVGAVAAVLGVVWTLQGLDVLGGSVMSGRPIWAVVGPLTTALGLVAVLVGARRRAS